MERQLTLKEFIPQKKRTFKDELFEILLSLNLPEYPNKYGNKQFTTFQKLALVILYFRYKLSLREFCDFINYESMWKRDLQLRYDIKKSTLNDWVRTFDLKLINKILKLTTKNDKPTKFGIDGSGLSSKYKSSYYEKKLSDFGINPKSPFHKLDIICDLDGKKKIFDFVFTLKQYNDKKQAKRLFKRFKIRNIVMIGDKGYYYFWLFLRMKELNNIFIVPPRNTGENCVHNNIVRRQFRQTYYDNKDLYPLRSNVEGVFSALKRTVLTKIVSKKYATKKREVALKIIIYNMKKNILHFFLKNYEKYLIFFLN